MDSREIRAAVRGIWQDVLDAYIDDDSDFYELGGHSFMAMQIVATLDEVLPCRTPVQLVLDYPCFGEFVAALARSSAAGE
jgi:acyl carrier protein